MHVVLLKPQTHTKGGLEKHAHRIAEAFLSRGAQLTWLCAAPPETIDARIEYRILKTLPWPGFVRLEQFNRKAEHVLQSLRSDIIFGLDKTRKQTHIRAGGGVHAAYLRSRKLAEGHFTYRTCLCNPLHRTLLKIEKAAFEFPGLKKIFTNSHMVKREILSEYSVDESKIMVIHNGVEWQEKAAAFAAMPTLRAGVQQQLGLNPDCFQILFIGHGFRRKGLGPLLEALARWKFRDFELAVVGEDKRKHDFQKKAHRLGLGRHVHWFGRQVNPEPFYQAADILAIPSFYDPFANVTLEALSFGLFVISSVTNGASEILTPNNGLSIENLFSTEEFLNALDHALLFRKTASRAAAIRASVASFNFSSQLNKLIDACL